MWNLAFWKTAAERALRTLAQVLLSLIVVGETGFMDVDWIQALSVAGLAALASILMSIVATGIGDKGTASLVREGDS
jgi:hypothetical protein